MSALRCPWWHSGDELAAGLRSGLGLPTTGPTGCQRRALACRARRALRAAALTGYAARLAVGAWRQHWSPRR